MKKFNLYLHSILIGMGFGMPTTIICMLLLGGYKPFFKEFIVWMVASALFGIISRLFFDNEYLTLPVATVLHFISCFIITVLAGTICGYANGILLLINGIAPIFIVAYLIIYIISMISMKIEVKKVNDALNERKSQ